MLSYLFALMIAASLIFSLINGSGDRLSAAALDCANEAVELLITMSGTICMWSGFMEIASRSGLTEKLSRLLSPALRKLFPDIEKDSKAFGYISMNVSANLLGLGNAATPLGLKAMSELKKASLDDRATDSMVTFVLMNTASVQLIPTTVATLRRSFGSVSPFDNLLCVWLTSAAALTVGLLCVKLPIRLKRLRFGG